MLNWVDVKSSVISALNITSWDVYFARKQTCNASWKKVWHLGKHGETFVQVCHDDCSTCAKSFNPKGNLCLTLMLPLLSFECLRWHDTVLRNLSHIKTANGTQNACIVVDNDTVVYMKDCHKLFTRQESQKNLLIEFVPLVCLSLNKDWELLAVLLVFRNCSI